MRILIIILFALLVSTVIATWIADNPGYLIIAFSDTTVQANLTRSLILLFLLFVLFYVLVQLFFSFVGAPKRYNFWKLYRRRRLSEKYLTRGLHALFEGKWRQAEIQLKKGVPYSRVPLVNYLGAARAAQQQGDLIRRDSYLKFAHESETGEDSIAVGLTQAELQLNQQQTEQALATLNNLHEKYPDHEQIKDMLLQVYSELKDWHAVLNLIPELERKKIITSEKIKSIQLGAYSGLLLQASKSGDKEELDNTWDKMPRKLRSEIYLLEIYTREKLKFADTKTCEPLLRKILKKQWDVGLVNLYGLMDSHDHSKQLKFAESLLAGHARDPILLLTLGRLSSRSNLWGKAKGYLEESIDVKPMPESYRELATLLEKQGEHVAANVYYQKGLTLATTVKLHESVKMLQKSEDQNVLCDGARKVV